MWTLEDFIRESNRIEGILRDPTEDEIDAQCHLARGGVHYEAAGTRCDPIPGPVGARKRHGTARRRFRAT